MVGNGKEDSPKAAARKQLAAKKQLGRKRGGQPGNLNAFKHGFYSEGFKSGEIADLDAYMAEGIQDEITMMRVITRRIFMLANGVGSIDEGIAMLGALGMASIRLASLLRMQRMLGGDGGQVGEAISQALTEVLAEMRAKKH